MTRSRSPRHVLRESRFRGVPAVAAASALLLLLPACTQAPPAVDHGTLAALLDAEDTRDASPDAWSTWLAHDDDAVRERAARGAGRLRDRALAPLLVDRLGTESAPAVREGLLFALGQLEEPSAASVLADAADAPAASERALALEAIGKLGADGPLDAVLAALEDPEGVVRREALYALVRLRGRRVRPPASLDGVDTTSLLARIEELTRDDAPDVRLAASYALSETPLPGRFDALEALARVDEPASRFFAARALGRLADAEPRALAPLVGLADDGIVHVAAAACAALGAFPDDAAGSALLRALSRSGMAADFHVRAAAAAALAGRAERAAPGTEPSPAILRSLLAATGDASPTVRRAGLVAAARVAAVSGGASAAQVRRDVAALVSEALGDDDPWLRAAAARAAGHLDAASAEPALGRALGDADARVVTAALGTVAGLGAESPFDAVTLARATLDPNAAGPPMAGLRDDLAVRATALGMLRELGDETDLPSVARVLREAEGDDAAELRLAALETIAALGGPDALALLVGAAADPSTAVASRAAELAAEHGADPPPEPRPDDRHSSVTPGIGTDVASDAPNPRATLRTKAGEIELELYREDAPRHVKSFVDLARRGFFDGLSIHRVVTGFVVQGLDPRGDGWGSGGVFLRDEINRVRYEPGTLGMPNSGPDTAGCQIFITHVPTPHLDGRYTVFGRVTRGMDVLDLAEVGDVVERVTID